MLAATPSCRLCETQAGRRKATAVADLRKKLSRSIWMWRLYHFFVADVVTIQRPTKYSFVYGFLGTDLGRVADIGCGPGMFLSHLCRHGNHVYAADIDEESLGRTLARRAGDRNLSGVVTLVSGLPFPDSFLDTVLFLEVLEHLEDDRQALRELWRVLVPGGKMVLSVPVPPGEINEGEKWGHKREGYLLKEIQGLVEAAGFQVVRHAYAQFIFCRLSDHLIRTWRNAFRLPAPCFLGWISYLDLLLSSKQRQQGECKPMDVVLLAEKTSAG